jgi:hypothetical protein
MNEKIMGKVNGVLCAIPGLVCIAAVVWSSNGLVREIWKQPLVLVELLALAAAGVVVCMALDVYRRRRKRREDGETPDTGP